MPGPHHVLRTVGDCDDRLTALTALQRVASDKADVLEYGRLEGEIDRVLDVRFDIQSREAQEAA